MTLTDLGQPLQSFHVVVDPPTERRVGDCHVNAAIGLPGRPPHVVVALQVFLCNNHTGSRLHTHTQTPTHPRKDTHKHVHKHNARMRLRHTPVASFHRHHFHCQTRRRWRRPTFATLASRGTDSTVRAWTDSWLGAQRPVCVCVCVYVCVCVRVLVGRPTALHQPLLTAAIIWARRQAQKKRQPCRRRQADVEANGHARCVVDLRGFNPQRLTLPAHTQTRVKRSYIQPKQPQQSQQQEQWSS